MEYINHQVYYIALYSTSPPITINLHYLVQLTAPAANPLLNLTVINESGSEPESLIT